MEPSTRRPSVQPHPQTGLHPVPETAGKADADISTAAASDAAAQSDTANSAEPSDGPRVYESEFGPVELPESLDRVVSIDFYTPAALIDIGINPVGVVNSYFTDTDGLAIPTDYTKAVLDGGAESIGEYYELNLEAVAKADPDLIIATDDFLPLDDPLRPELEKLAPIVTFSARDGDSWRTRAEGMAEIFGKEDVLAEKIASYETKRDAVKAEYADLLAEETFAVFVPTDTEWGTYASTHFATPILRDLGATFREQQADEVNEAKFPNWFSYESLNRLDNASVIMILTSAPDAVTALDSNVIWQNLPAVKDGLVFDYIKLSPTGSFGWAEQNLEGLTAVFDQIQTAKSAQGS